MTLHPIACVRIIFALTPIGVDKDSVGEMGRGPWDLCLA